MGFYGKGRYFELSSDLIAGKTAGDELEYGKLALRQRRVLAGLEAYFRKYFFALVYIEQESISSWLSIDLLRNAYAPRPNASRA